VASIILRLPAVKACTGLSRSSIYLRMTQGTFPKPVSLGARAVGWRQSEVDDWLAALDFKPTGQSTARQSTNPVGARQVGS
jgi:prophage regulatory protein